MIIDIEALRSYLEDYYGTAAFSGFPVAIVDAIKVQKATDSEIILLAQKQGIDLRQFAVTVDGSN